MQLNFQSEQNDNKNISRSLTSRWNKQQENELKSILNEIHITESAQFEKEKKRVNPLNMNFIRTHFQFVLMWLVTSVT